MCEEYNGWTNRETWAVALYINNDQGWQESVHEALREGMAELPEGYNGEPFPESYRASRAGEIIRENVEETLDALLDAATSADRFGVTDRRAADTYHSIRDDLGSLYRVNWTELGAAFLSDIAEA